MDPILAIAITHALSLAAILFILRDQRNFLNRALVFMKAQSIHDVLDGASLLRETSQKDEGEVIDDVAMDAENKMREMQAEHRKRYQ